MATVLRELFSVLSAHYKRRTIQLQLAALLQAFLDALAFGLLYPLLELFTSPSTAHTSKAVRITGDALGTHQSAQLELRLGITIIILFILSSACGILLTRAQCHVVAGSEADVSSRLFSRYLQSPYLEHIQRNSGDLNRNVFPVCLEIHQNVLLSFLVLGANLFTIIVLVVVIAIANVLVTAVSVAYFVCVAYLYARVVGPRARWAGIENLRMSGLAFRASQEGFAGLKAFQASGAVDSVVTDYKRRRHLMAQYRYQVLFYATLPQYYLQSAMIGGVVVFALIIVLTHASNATALVSLIVASSIRLMPCLYQVLSSTNKIRSGQASVHEVHSDLLPLSDPLLQRTVQDLRPLSPRPRLDPSNRRLDWEFKQSIAFNNVGFTYPQGVEEALMEVSLVIPKGSSVGFVGPSGAGKTTIVDLLLGMFPPSRGAILVDGNELSGDMIRKWRSRVAYVPQESFLLDATIGQNVSFDKDHTEVDSSKVWSALERAHITDLVAGLPDGIETIVGERGVRFSGGQRQRLGIARALYREPAVLILDEATSALDTPTEAAFAATVEQLRGSLTLITVAHRLSTVRRCDTIFLMERGRLVADGPFEALRRNSELFDEMARLARIESP